jgi:RNA-binding protein
MTTSETTTAVLSTRQRQFLKGLAHSLTPYAQIGKEGLSENLISAVSTELDRHELIKVKIVSTSDLEKKATAATLAERTRSCLVQLIGKTIVLYRPSLEKPKDKRIKLPSR